MEKFKAAVAKGISGKPVSDEEAGEAMVEVADVIASIADSLKRIADNGEQLRDCIKPGDAVTHSRLCIEPNA